MKNIPHTKAHVWINHHLIKHVLLYLLIKFCVINSKETYMRSVFLKFYTSEKKIFHMDKP